MLGIALRGCSEGNLHHWKHKSCYLWKHEPDICYSVEVRPRGLRIRLVGCWRYTSHGLRQVQESQLERSTSIRGGFTCRTAIQRKGDNCIEGDHPGQHCQPPSALHRLQMWDVPAVNHRPPRPLPQNHPGRDRLSLDGDLFSQRYCAFEFEICVEIFGNLEMP